MICIDGMMHEFRALFSGRTARVRANAVKTVAINETTYIDHVQTVYCRKCLVQFELPEVK
jgi:hypothetical protein